MPGCWLFRYQYVYRFKNNSFRSWHVRPFFLQKKKHLYFNIRLVSMEPRTIVFKLITWCRWLLFWSFTLSPLYSSLLLLLLLIPCILFKRSYNSWARNRQIGPVWACPTPNSYNTEPRPTGIELRPTIYIFLDRSLFSRPIAFF